MMSRPRRFFSLATLGVALALVLYWFMASSVSRDMGVTADEVVHLTGGYTYWKFNDYRLHPENGTLPMRIATLPWLAMDLKFPPRDDHLWYHSRVNHLGEAFFFDLGNPLETMLARARAMIALVGAFTAWLTWRWAQALFGPTAGWLALGLAVFCPALLAHGGLATSDITLTACMLGALSLVWQCLHRVTWARLLGATVACGLAFLAKMSGVLLVPLIAAMVVIRWLRPAPLVVRLGRERWLRRRSQVMVATTLLTVAMAAGSLVVLWGGYSFRFDGLKHTPGATEEYFFPWDVILDKKPIPGMLMDGQVSTPANEPGAPPVSALTTLLPRRLPQQESNMSHLVETLRQRHLLPEAYLWGFAHTYKFSRYRPAFFMGEYRSTGWRTFFPTAFLMKTTLPALLLILVGVAALAYTARGKSRGVPRLAKPWLYRATPLVAFFVMYWAMAIQMSLNIGHRHILPTYPIFYIFASAAALWLATPARRILRWALIAALGLHAADSLAVRPYYLSYFQPLVCGVDKGYRYFVDSSYDWGQGLPALTHWLEAKKTRGDPSPVFLSYFGADSPRGRKLDVIRFGDEITDWGERVYPAQLRAGWYAIGATHFQRVYMPVRGPWSERHERLYQEILGRLVTAERRTTPRTPEGDILLSNDARDYEMLQFGRLMHALRDRPPHEIIGGSILLFQLSDDELRSALYGPLTALPP